MKRIRKLFSLAVILGVTLLLVSGCISNAEREQLLQEEETNIPVVTELKCIESYGLVSAKLEYHTTEHGSLSGHYLFCFGGMSGSYEKITTPIYKFWYQRSDGGILEGTIDMSKYPYPKTVSIVVYENDSIKPKFEIWRNDLATQYGDGERKSIYFRYAKKTAYPKTEFRFTIPKGTFVNTYDFQGITEKKQ